MRLALLVIHTPAFGGPHNQALRLHKPLRQRGWETLVVLPEGEGTGATRLEAAGVEVVRMPLGRARATLNPLVQLRFAARLQGDLRRLRRLLRERRVDLVQVHGVQNPQGVLAARRERVPVVCQLLGTSAPPWVRRLVTPWMLRRAQIVMTVGRAVAEAHPGVCELGDRWLTFAPPLDLEAFRPDGQRRIAARKELGIEPDEFLMGTVGSFFRAKAHEVFVEAAARVSRDVGKAVFRVLGEEIPTHHDYYQREVVGRARRHDLLRSGRLRFVQPGPRVADLLPAFDVFVLSSIAEGMPNVLLEAMGCGLPVVATDVGSVGEIVEHERTGFLTAARDSAAIARSVVRLARDGELRTRMGHEARRRAEERFGSAVSADRHAEAYRRALAAFA